MIVPISEASQAYAAEVRTALRQARLHADVDASDRKMQKKVREAQLEQYNYILVRARRAASPARRLLPTLRRTPPDLQKRRRGKRSLAAQIMSCVAT